MILVDSTDQGVPGASAYSLRLDIRLLPAMSARLPFVQRIFILFGAVCLSVGIVFMGLGAQPVLGFMGLELILLYAAYKCCIRNARHMEHVTVTENHLIVRKTDRYGSQSLIRFDPRWSNLRTVSTKLGTGLIIYSKGRAQNFGGFLDPFEHDEVLKLLDVALRRIQR